VHSHNSSPSRPSPLYSLATTATTSLYHALGTLTTSIRPGHRTALTARPAHPPSTLIAIARASRAVAAPKLTLARPRSTTISSLRALPTPTSPSWLGLRCALIATTTSSLTTPRRASRPAHPLASRRVSATRHTERRPLIQLRPTVPTSSRDSRLAHDHCQRDHSRSRLRQPRPREDYHRAPTTAPTQHLVQTSYPGDPYLGPLRIVAHSSRARHAHLFGLSVTSGISTNHRPGTLRPVRSRPFI
jgi:hypothetical protein